MKTNRFFFRASALVVWMGATVAGQAQVLTPDDDGIVPKDSRHYANARVIEYPYLRQDDMVWSTRYWERIDIREKINHPLYYPVKPQPDRKSLFDVMKDAILTEGTITQVFRDDKFERPMTTQEVFGVLSRVDTIRDPDDPSIILVVDTIEIKAPNVVAWDIKSDWFFDKQRGEMKNRIIAISPRIQEPGGAKEEYNPFWIWFPDARQAMATNVAYNPQNNNQRMSYDQIFHMRYFNSRVLKEDNTYDRSIEEYKMNNPMGQLLEAQQIKENLRNFEHDLWEY